MYLYINEKPFGVDIVYTHETGKFKLIHATRYSNKVLIEDRKDIIESEEHYILNEVFPKMAVVIRKYYKI